MENNVILQHNILYSCAFQKEQSSEHFFPEHALGIVLSGESHYFTNEGTFVMKAGTMALMRRNQLFKKLKMPAANGEPFQLISIFLDQQSLHNYAAEHDIRKQNTYNSAAMIDLSGDPFLKGFFDSLLPYMGNVQKLTEKIAALKTYEVIELLLQMDDSFKKFLFDFQEPHKIDLEAYMNQNYKYNVTLSTFGKLTGRSLSTFKRDFAKIFDKSPEKWLHHKRLEQAHYLISKRQQRPSKVYLEVGFENLSHFSSAFKKFFGFTPSDLISDQKNTALSQQTI